MSTQSHDQDVDQQETHEWLEAIEGVLQADGADRAHFLLEQMIDKLRRSGANLPHSSNTAYVNTIPTHLQANMPGDVGIERRIRALIRWNAAAMVVKANRKASELGGHIASFASAATLYDVGMNHFWRAPNHEHGGDLVFFQGHSAPGMYSRAYLEGRLNEEQLDNFRQEVDGNGLSSYPHPWLMPDFWQFPTVSMGLGPISAIYQARFMKYLQDRGLADTRNRDVWCFMGDGETDEPESLGAISLATREKLDNLTISILPPTLKLPALPVAVTQFMERSKDPEASLKDLAEIIETDSGLTIELLRHLNSSFVGLRHKATSAMQALSLLGRRQSTMFLITTGIIMAHEVPQEIGDYGVLVYGGFSKLKALVLNFATALASIIGGVLGFFLFDYIGVIKNNLLPFAGGGFIYIALADLIPENNKKTKPSDSILQLTFMLTGILLTAYVK